MSHPQSVLVAGDLVLDHHIYEGRRYHYGDGMNRGVRVFKQPGGAGLIHHLLFALFEQKRSSEVGPDTARQWQSFLAAQIPEDLEKVDESQHAYAFWRPYPVPPRAGNRPGG